MISEPDDLGVKIGSVEEKAWSDIKKKAENELLQLRRESIINEEIANLAKKRIKIEKEKFK